VKQADGSVRFKAVLFDRFKGLPHFRVGLADMNILVGANNAGKSTVIAAFRALAAGLRAARSRRPDLFEGPGGKPQIGWAVSPDQIPISMENVHTDYESEPSSVRFELTNGTSLLLWFPVDGGCRLFATDRDGRPARSGQAFRSMCPVNLGVVPVLGPVEHEEAVVEGETVARNLATHRASRNFRNYWLHFPEHFARFAELIARTWPGLTVKPPEVFLSTDGRRVDMFCSENRVDRELYWVGFGFQIWCQLLTHLVRNVDADLIVLDEPETYLHPELQRKLVNLLRSARPAVLLATHSSEIIGEAEPTELLLVTKGARSARRIRPEGIEEVLAAVGSVLNPTLTRLARTWRVLFVEGGDFKILARFAKKRGQNDLASGEGFVVVPMGGFANWERVKHLGWGIERTLGASLALGIILDRDYRSNEEIADVEAALRENLGFVHILDRKEIENFLLEPAALLRAVNAELVRTSAAPIGEQQLHDELQRITEDLREDVYAQHFARRLRRARSRIDDSTLIKAISKEFEASWADRGTRLRMVPGKVALSMLNTRLRDQFGINLTHARITEAIREHEVDPEMIRILTGIEALRIATPPAAVSAGPVEEE
jgi:hypothetical protein